MAITLEKNSINVLESRFQNLLKGVDTEKYRYNSNNQKQTTIRTIKSFVRERISEKKLDPTSEIWKIVRDIEKLKFENLEEIKKVYSRLYNLKKDFHSDYYKQVGKEDNSSKLFK